MNSVEFTVLWTDDDGMVQLAVKASSSVMRRITKLISTLMT